jgi:Prokaryotic homologs of the JAB domain
VLIATETFVDPTDGQLVEAGKTRCSEDADVVRLFPSRFRPDREQRRGGRRLIRGGGTAGIPAGRKPATPLPTLFEELEPTYMATLGYEAKKTIRADIAWTEENIGDVETGGWLLAAKRNRDYILAATVPGSDATCTRSSINLGVEQLEAAQRKYHHHRVVGCWHYHGCSGDVPSETDLRAFARGAGLASGYWIGLIATRSRSWRPEPEISGWVTFGSRPDLLITERLQVVT